MLSLSSQLKAQGNHLTWVVLYHVTSYHYDMVLIHVLLRDCHAAWGFHQDKANTLVDSDKFLNLYTGRFKDLFPHNEMVRLQAATLTSFYIDSSMVRKFNR